MAKPKAGPAAKPAPAKPPEKTRPPKSAGKSVASNKRRADRLSAAPPCDRLERLWSAIEEVRQGRRASPRTARLLASGTPKMAQKVIEEAGEVAIEAVLGRREALVNESVDLLYNLAALCNAAGVRLETLWFEMDRREAAFGLSEKLPKTDEV